MPNWVDNKLVITGPVETINRFVDRAEGNDPVYCTDRVKTGQFQVFSFHALCPVPLNVMEEAYSQNGFNWEIKHWGCKWGASQSQIERISLNKVVYTFDTPNGPPIVLLSNLAQEYDDLVFCLGYEADEFEGLVKFKKGIVVKSLHRRKEDS